MFQLMKNVLKTLILIAMMAVVYSCSMERKLATGFVGEEAGKSALLLSTDALFKKSIKTNLLDSLEITDESLFDSVLYANSDFVKEIDDPLFLRNFLIGFEQELKVFGFSIYKESQMADFMEIDSNAYVIYLAQIELEESYYTFRDETAYLDNYYYHDHSLNAISVYSWFEISKVNEKKEKHVYFADDMIVDEVDGEFTLDFFGGDVKYLYQIDSLKVKDLYEYAFVLGRTYAGYTFDLLMNNYIRKNMPEKPEEYLRYDPYNKQYFPATNDRFITLDE